MARVIRNFEIQDMIGRGGMASLYKAVQTSLDRVVAIKELYPHLAQDQEFILRFEREAKSAASLKHENIIDVIDFGTEGEVYFIAMEFVDGKPLKDLIAQAKVLPLSIAITIIAEILSGLDHAHSKGVVHRDIKPGNILISKEGITKIADFGLAQSGSMPTLTVTGALVGTPAYMSPEQAAGRKIDQRSDVFSTGVMLYEMITGSKPFQGEGYSTIITKILTETPPPIKNFVPNMPPEIERVLVRSLEKDVDRRYLSAGDMLKEIESYAERENLIVSRKDIARFVENPEEFGKELREKRIQEYLEKGMQLMDLGGEKVDDAIDIFSKVIVLDPQSELARDSLTKLKKIKKDREDSIAQKMKAATAPERAAAADASTTSSSVTIVQKPKSAFLPVMLTMVFMLILGVGGFLAYDRFVNNGKLLRIALSKIVPPEEVAEPEVIQPPAPAQPVQTAAAVPAPRESAPPPPVRTERKEAPEKKKPEVAARPPEKKVMPPPVKVAPPPPPKPVGSGFIRVSATPWAKVYIDGQYVGTTPLAQPVKVSAGKHRVQMTNPEFQDWAADFNVEPDKTVEKAVTLQPVPPAYFKVTAVPWADVYIDGEKIATTPIANAIELKSGRHRVRLVNPGCEEWNETIEFQPYQTVSRDVRLMLK